MSPQNATNRFKVDLRLMVNRDDARQWASATTGASARAVPTHRLKITSHR
jgi:hypothetical protein